MLPKSAVGCRLKTGSDHETNEHESGKRVPEIFWWYDKSYKYNYRLDQSWVVIRLDTTLNGHMFLVTSLTVWQVYGTTISLLTSFVSRTDLWWGYLYYRQTHLQTIAVMSLMMIFNRQSYYKIKDEISLSFPQFFYVLPNSLRALNQLSKHVMICTLRARGIDSCIPAGGFFFITIAFLYL